MFGGGGLLVWRWDCPFWGGGFCSDGGLLWWMDWMEELTLCIMNRRVGTEEEEEEKRALIARIGAVGDYMA